LPPQALRPHPGAFVSIGVHLAVMASCWIASAYVPSIWWPLLGLVAGISRGSLSFLAHDVAHRTVVTNRYLLYPTELVLWALVFIPATVWRRVHRAHHAHVNAADDPERRWAEIELSPVAFVAAAGLMPNRALPYNVLCCLYWLTWPFRNAIALLFPGDAKPGFVTAKPRYSRAEKLWVAFEVLFIAAVQLGLWKLLHRAYPWVGLGPVLVATVIISAYFFTNHGLRPLGDGKDTLAATTSVAVPEFFNRLHSYFAYHTEHHLFPTMNPKFYPLVRNLLGKHFPDRYQCIPFGEAWSHLWRQPIAHVDSRSLIALSGAGRRPVQTGQPLYAATGVASTAEGA
jgi:fatty acid desaturase